MAAETLLLALAIAGAAHLLFWRWWLGAPGGEDELVEAVAADGWRLAMGRRRPRGQARITPVLLMHGIAMNRQALDFGVERWSLSAALSAGGLDCFALDLRGHGGSRRRAPGAEAGWTLDHYLSLDVPAALEAIERATGERRVLWVGHSQGALLGLAAAQRYPDRIAGVVALAPPVRLPVAAVEQRALGELARWRLLRPLSALVAPLSGWWQPRRAGLALQLGNMERPIYRRLLMNAIEELPPGVVSHFQRLAREQRIGSFDGSEDWDEGLGRCRQPALFVAAPRDGLAPRAGVEEGHARWGGEKSLLVAAPEVGHTDLVLGKRAPTELFPAVRDWLTARSPLRGAASARPAPGRDPAPGA
jgi:pimeloyl-ACP methyl ester carboxylesterase